MVLTDGSHQLEAFAVFPYVQKRYIRDDVQIDRILYNMAWALKDGRSFADNKNELREPCDWVVKYLDRTCPALAQDRMLVPVPRKIVTPDVPNAKFWPGLRLANALRAAGFGRAVAVAVRRQTAVAGSTGRTSQAERVTVQQHVDSLVVDLRQLRRETKITLVDDTLVTGTQFMGAARALERAGFKGSILAYAAFHALSNPLKRDRNIHSALWWDGMGGWARRDDE